MNKKLIIPALACTLLLLVSGCVTETRPVHPHTDPPEQSGHPVLRSSFVDAMTAPRTPAP